MTYYSISEPRAKDEGYGIRIINIRIVRDISTDYEAVKTIADKCNAGKLSPCHFDDVLESFLSDLEGF